MKGIDIDLIRAKISKEQHDKFAELSSGGRSGQPGAYDIFTKAYAGGRSIEGVSECLDISSATARSFPVRSWNATRACIAVCAEI